MLTVCIANHIRSSLRASVVQQAFGPDMRKRLRATLWMDRWLTFLWMTVHWLVVLGALTGRTITWRGYRYRLRAPQRIELINRV